MGGVIQEETTHTTHATLRIVLVIIGEGQLHYQTHLRSAVDQGLGFAGDVKGTR